MAYTQSRQTIARPALAGLTRLGDRALATLRAWRIYNRTLTDLSALNDRELADLGLTRGQITGIARDAAYGAGR